MKDKINVLYMVTIPSPYRVDFFNELGKLCNLTVLFERKYNESRKRDWHNHNFNQFEGIYLKGFKYKKSKSISFGIIKHLNNNTYDHIIIGGYATPTAMITIEYLKFKNQPFILNIDGGFIKVNERLINYKLKKHFISSADVWLSTGQESNKYLTHYGAKEESIYKYPFTTLNEEDIISSRLTLEEKILLKNKLGIKEDKVIITVGRFIYSKGFDVLMKAVKNLSKDIGVYFIGGNPTDEYIQLKNKLGLRNVKFVGFKTKKELSEYYKLADLFILPTREDIWGLVINEAMAFGLPVITTNKCVAGLELIENYTNGFIVPVDDYEELELKIIKLLSDLSLLKNMSENNLKKSKEYTIENMAQVTLNILENIGKNEKNASR